MTDFDALAALERRTIWLSAWTIHAANHLRPADDLDVKVGGQQASCASMSTIMTALYFHALRPNQLYSAFAFQGAAAWRRRLHDDLGDQGPVSALIDRRSHAELAALMENLGGHDLPALVAAFEAAARHDRPVLFPTPSRAPGCRLPGARTTTPG